MYRITCHHEWREVIDVNAIAIAIACNRCGEREPIKGSRTMINAIPDNDEIAETLMELHGWARVERGEPDNRWMAHPTSLTDIYGWFTIDDKIVAQAYLEATLITGAGC